MSDAARLSRMRLAACMTPARPHPRLVPLASRSLGWPTPSKTGTRLGRAVPCGEVAAHHESVSGVGPIGTLANLPR